MSLITQRGEWALQPRSGEAIEANPLKLRTSRCQPGKIVALLVADRRIEAARAPAAGNRIPQSNAVREQRRESIVIIERVQWFVENRAEQTPELILRVRVILRLAQRRLARETAKDQGDDAGIDDRREAMLAGVAQGSSMSGRLLESVLVSGRLLRGR